MKKIILSLVITFTFILSQTLLSQVTWQQCPGVFGGDVRCFAVASNGYTYMGSNGSGIYKTIDGGDNWSKVNTGILNLNVRAMAFNSSDHLYAGIQSGTGYGILKTTNNGINWNYTALSDIDIRTIVINSSGHIFVGMDTSGIYRSTDNGASYSLVNNGLTFRNIRSIAINSSGVLFAAAYTGGVFRSTDNGDNWFQVNTGLTNLYANSIAVNPVNGYLFVGTGNANSSGAVYRSTNNGGIWTIMTLTNVWILHIAINPAGVIYAGRLFDKTATVTRSTDGGGTWNGVGECRRNAGFTSLILNNTRIYVGTNVAIFRSVNNGSFDILQQGFTGQIVYSFFIPNAIGNVLAGTNFRGFCRTTDGGANWSYVSEELYLARNIYAYAINSFGFIYAASWSYPPFSRSSIFKSQNNGASWSEMTNQYWNENSIRAMCINYLDYIFAGTIGAGIYRSVDHGANWTAINLSNNNVWALLSVDSTASIFAGTGGGKIFRSTDNGFGWNQVYINSLTTNNVRSLAKSKTNIIYAGLDTGGIILSTNNGTTWIQSGFTGSSVNAIVFNSFNYIFAGTGNNGVYRSTDNGVTWTQVNNGFTNNNRINALAIDAAGYLYAGLNGGSVYKSTESSIAVRPISNEVPKSFSLSQNYPNPFNPSTNIKFELPKNNYVTLIIYDALGREIATLVNEQLKAGTYQVDWQADSYTSGVYFYKLTAGDFVETKKMVLLK